MLTVFLGLAYAELKVNFVEGFAVHVSMHTAFLGFYGFSVFC